MKYLAASLLTVLLSTMDASAQVLFSPDFTSGLPSGYTVTNSNVATPPDSISYSGGVATFGDYSIPGANDVDGNPTSNKNYITSTTTTGPGSDTITSSFSFTPNYSYTGNGGGQGNINVFSLYTETANNALFSVTLQPFRYSGNANIVFSAGVQYGTDGTSGGTATQYSSSGINSLSGLTLTVNVVTTSTDLGPNIGPNFTAGQGDRWEVENQGTLYAGSTLLYTFDVFAIDDTANGYDPATGKLTLSTGIIDSTEDNNVSGSYFSPGATVGISNITVIAGAVPEPSTYALLGVGLVAIFFATRRRSAV